MCDVIPIKPGIKIGKPKQTLEEALLESMPDGYCHWIVIGMDDKHMVGMALSKMETETALFMISDVKQFLEAE